MLSFNDVKEICMKALWAAGFACLGESATNRIIKLVKKIENNLSEQSGVSITNLNDFSGDLQISGNLCSYYRELSDLISELEFKRI